DVGDARVDDVGVGARQHGGDRDDRELDAREAIDADTVVGHEPEQHEHRARHEGEHVPPDGEFGQLHDRASVVPGSRTVTSAPSVRKPAPETTTVSPVSMPEST